VSTIKIPIADAARTVGFAMYKGWAKPRQPEPEEPRRREYGLTAQGRARIIAAQKRRRQKEKGTAR
jgi:hypothetical protein